MNYRVISIIVAICIMIISPTAAGLIVGGQASDEAKNEEFDKDALERKEVELYITSTGEKITIDLEEYVIRVMLAEVPSSFNIEALKAMSVAIRSYCLRRMDSVERYTKHFSAHVCTDYTHCLGYISPEEASDRWGEDSADALYKIMEDAVSQTRGEVLYYEGGIADTVFHASSFGFTESAENIWGFEIPYLVSVSTPEAVSVTYAEYTSNEFKSILESEGIYCKLTDGPSGWIKNVEKGENNRVKNVNISGTVITGRRIREIFGLKSTAFSLVCNDGVFKFEVSGNGHGVGMSQYGCSVLAEEGMEYREILAHYYKGTELALYKQ